MQYLYDFLVRNTDGAGPYAEEIGLEKLEPGDIVQLGTATGDFYHSPVVVEIKRGMIFVAAHSSDAYGRPLTSYSYARARGIHLLGFRRG